MAVQDRLLGLTGGVAFKAPVVIASTGANLTLSSSQVIDGVVVGTTDDEGTRILVKDQTDAKENGIYVSSNTWARAKDFDGERDVIPGTLVYVGGLGSQNANTFWQFNATSTATSVSIGSTKDDINVTQVTQALGVIPLTTEGDLLTYLSGAASRLAIGSSGLVLISTGGDPAWGTVGSTGITDHAIQSTHIVDSAVKSTQTSLGSLTVTSTASGASAGPTATLYRDSSAPTASDSISYYVAAGNNSAGTKTTYAAWLAQIISPTTGAESGGWVGRTKQLGTEANRIVLRLGLYTPNASGGDKGADTINASAIYDDGVQILPSVVDTKVSSTSSTAIEFTGIPSWVKRVTMTLDGVSDNIAGSSSRYLVQIGSSDGYESTGYTSYSVRMANGTANDGRSDTAGFVINTENFSTGLYGSVRIEKHSSDIWVADHIMGMNTGPVGGIIGGGSKTISGILERVRLTMVSSSTIPAPNFDAGSVNIKYE